MRLIEVNVPNTDLTHPWAQYLRAYTGTIPLSAPWTKESPPLL